MKFLCDYCKKNDWPYTGDEFDKSKPVQKVKLVTCEAHVWNCVKVICWTCFAADRHFCKNHPQPKPGELGSYREQLVQRFKYKYPPNLVTCTPCPLCSDSELKELIKTLRPPSSSQPQVSCPFKDKVTHALAGDKPPEVDDDPEDADLVDDDEEDDEEGSILSEDPYMPKPVDPSNTLFSALLKKKKVPDRFYSVSPPWPDGARSDDGTLLAQVLFIAEDDKKLLDNGLGNVPIRSRGNKGGTAMVKFRCYTFSKERSKLEATLVEWPATNLPKIIRWAVPPKMERSNSAAGRASLPDFEHYYSFVPGNEHEAAIFRELMAKKGKEWGLAPLPHDKKTFELIELRLLAGSCIRLWIPAEAPTEMSESDYEDYLREVDDMADNYVEAEHDETVYPPLDETEMTEETPDTGSERESTWNGRRFFSALDSHEAVSKAWETIAALGIGQRRYKDSGNFAVTKSKGDRKSRPQNIGFESRSATEVYSDRTNKEFAALKVIPLLNKERGIFYEWCHLIGDSKGGGVHRENLVVGSSANNTEQLVMENVISRGYGPCQKAGIVMVLRVRSLTLPHLKYEFYYPQTFEDLVKLLPDGQRAGAQEEIKRVTGLFNDFGRFIFHSHTGDWTYFSLSLLKGKQRIDVFRHLMDAQRPKISKPCVRVMEFQATYQMHRALNAMGAGYDDEFKNQPKMATAEDKTLFANVTSRTKRVQLSGPIKYAAQDNVLAVEGGRFRAKDNAGGGNCLFHAIADARSNGAPAPDAHQQLRRLAVEHLRRIRENGAAPGLPWPGNMNNYGTAAQPIQRAEFLEMMGVYLSEYNLRWPGYGYQDAGVYQVLMGDDRYWGDLIIVSVLSHLLQLKINVVVLIDGNLHNWPVNATGQDNPPQIFLFNPNGQHFVALLPA